MESAASPSSVLAHGKHQSISDGMENDLFNEYEITGRAGMRAYREFQFDQSWEIVPGEWTFEFWHGKEKIGEQKFCVFVLLQDNSAAPSRQSTDCHQVSS